MLEGFEEAVRDACGVGFIAEQSGTASGRVLPLALEALARMVHRGAVDADGRTGDGAGVMTQIPFALFEKECSGSGLTYQSGDLAVGLVFLPKNALAAWRSRRRLEDLLSKRGLTRCIWRVVPVNEPALGDRARDSQPTLAHVLVPRSAHMSLKEFETGLTAARRDAEYRYSSGELYIASLSNRTLVYKALVRATDLAAFFPDLENSSYSTSFAIFHQRFSTNTAPSWSMTQPFRLAAHNGEINTISGNRRWMHARAVELSAIGAPAEKEQRSDSASFDDALATLTAAGRTIAHGMSMLVPPAWEHDRTIPQGVRAFFDYNASLMQPWDGPAMIAFSDGKHVGAALDRNGLRPARTLITKDGLVVVSSEAGIIDVGESHVLSRGRLGPGDMLVVDLEKGGYMRSGALREDLAHQNPYQDWISARRVTLDVVRGNHPIDKATYDIRALRAMGCTREELLLILTPMYRDGVEPLGSMGDDAPLAILSSAPRPLFSYFRQRFAQVTNPPIDSIRETLVMALDVRLGASGDLLADAPPLGEHVYLDTPILHRGDVGALSAWKSDRWQSANLDLRVRASGGPLEFEPAIEALLQAAEQHVRSGVSCLIMSDASVDEHHTALPTLLATAAVHQHLVRTGLRMKTSLVVDAGDARDEHAVAALLAYGANAVCPRMGYDAIAYCVKESGNDDAAYHAGCERYRIALKKGLLKIMAKMGVSTLRSYQGAGLFEAIGIADTVIERHFTGTPSAIGGIGLVQIAEETLAHHRAAFSKGEVTLEDGGVHRYRKDGEPHAYEPRVIRTLHKAILSGERIDYRAYADLVHQRAPIALRDLMEIRTSTPISIDEVEGVESILPRFMSSAMSLGSLSPEAQQTIAIAMNRIGSRSNSGEGGEAHALHWNDLHGQERTSARVKQVASGRFGVTAAYLMSADQLQIKMSQGSKPGEGGQLPGTKVTEHIARVRHAVPGTTLISPPPHHDIYSIEDLAQLIYDLKSVNPAATVSVKLVASAGIGTIAVGVTKAYADAIQISGHDGGTGASPRGSIKNAGSPWELGLSEAHQALVRAGMRGRVRLQVDGGLKTGRDVVLAALLGAEEFGFGTAALVAAGCVMARQCHLNTCPAGIATQREDLRKKFTATPEDVIRFFTSVAEEVREILALMGVSRLADIVGCTELIEARIPVSGKASTIRFDRLFASVRRSGPTHSTQARNDPPRTGAAIDERVLAALRLRRGVVQPVKVLLPVTNADRSIGARIAGAVVERTHAATIAAGTVQLHLKGTAGQSFGAFCVGGMRLVLDGDANDYVGKGMSGGEIVVRPVSGNSRSNDVIAGNTILYGATGGIAHFAGRVGERFAVRNSGAVAVAEGTGDHAGEYMTAGALLILGSTGRNLGAGMTGGVLFAYDPRNELKGCVHPEWVAIDSALTIPEEQWVRDLVDRHHTATGSYVAEKIQRDWKSAQRLFRRVAPLTAVSPVILPLLPVSQPESLRRVESRGASYVFCRPEPQAKDLLFKRAAKLARPPS